MAGRLQGKTALVTAAGQGMGRAAVLAFAREGARVIATDLKPEFLAGLPAGVSTSQLDVLDDAAVQAFVEGIAPVDILFNCAGYVHQGTILDCGVADWDFSFDLNVRSMFVLTKAMLPKMIGAGGGVILNMASTAGVSPRPRLSWYNASKGWVITATRALAVELAPFGIRVVALNPVAGETPLLKTFMGEDTPEMRAKFLATIPIGRFSQPEDLGNAACFLCSDEASMITGVCMEVDGGRCI